MMMLDRTRLGIVCMLLEDSGQMRRVPSGEGRIISCKMVRAALE